MTSKEAMESKTEHSEDVSIAPGSVLGVVEAAEGMDQVEQDKVALLAILDQTRKEIFDTENECMLLTEILCRKKFKILSDGRPFSDKDRKKRKVEGTAPTSAKKSKPAPVPAAAAAPTGPQVKQEVKAELMA